MVDLQQRLRGRQPTYLRRDVPQEGRPLVHPTPPAATATATTSASAAAWPTGTSASAATTAATSTAAPTASAAPRCAAPDGTAACNSPDQCCRWKPCSAAGVCGATQMPTAGHLLRRQLAVLHRPPVPRESMPGRDVPPRRLPLYAARRVLLRPVQQWILRQWLVPADRVVVPDGFAVLHRGLVCEGGVCRVSPSTGGCARSTRAARPVASASSSIAATRPRPASTTRAAPSRSRVSRTASSPAARRPRARCSAAPAPSATPGRAASRKTASLLAPLDEALGRNRGAGANSLEGDHLGAVIDSLMPFDVFALSRDPNRRDVLGIDDADGVRGRSSAASRPRGSRRAMPRWRSRDHRTKARAPSRPRARLQARG